MYEVPLDKFTANGHLPKPEKTSRNQGLFNHELTMAAIAADCAEGTHISRRAKSAVVDLEKAAEVCDEGIVMFDKVHRRLMAAQESISTATRAVSTNVRKAANEIGEGVQRIERMANFQTLEARVVLLERAAAAMKTLADLEREGRLAKVIAAMK